MKYTIALLFCLFLSSCVVGLNRYVTTDAGNGMITGDCSSENNACTFIYALQQAQQQDTIFIGCTTPTAGCTVGAGTGLPLVLGDYGLTDVSIIGQTDSVIFDCSNIGLYGQGDYYPPCVDLTLRDGFITLQNITFTNYAPEVEVGGTGDVFQAYSLINAHEYGYVNDTKYTDALAGGLLVIRDCIFSDFVVDPDFEEKDGLMSVIGVFGSKPNSDGDTILIDNCQFNDNQATGVVSAFAQVTIKDSEFTNTQGQFYASIFSASVHPYFGGANIVVQDTSINQMDIGDTDMPLFSFQGESCIDDDDNTCVYFNIKNTSIYNANQTLIKVNGAASLRIDNLYASDFTREVIKSDLSNNVPSYANIIISDSNFEQSSATEYMMLDVAGSSASAITGTTFTGSSTQTRLIGSWEITDSTFTGFTGRAITTDNAQLYIGNCTFDGTSLADGGTILSVGNNTVNEGVYIGNYDSFSAPGEASSVVLYNNNITLASTGSIVGVGEYSELFISNNDVTTTGELPFILCNVDADDLDFGIKFGAIINFVGNANNIDDNVKIVSDDNDDSGCLFECNDDNSDICQGTSDDTDDFIVVDSGDDDGNGAVIGLSITLSFVLLYAIILTVVVVGLVGYKVYLKRTEYVSLN